MAAVKGLPPKRKIEEIEKIKKLISSYRVLALVSFQNVPANLMQNIKREFKNTAEMRVVKNTLLNLALDSIGKGYERMKNHIKGQIAIIATNDNPFKLYKKIENLKINAPIKPNQIAPTDIVVNEGPTSLAPGPAVAELQMVGIPAAVEKGKVVIKSNATVVKAGETVRPEVAKALEKLGIKPLRLGLETIAIYDGVILTPELLKIDEKAIIEDFQNAYKIALNLAVNCCYVTKETAEILLLKAFNDARKLAINVGIAEKETITDLITKAHMQMLSLASLLPPEALDEDLKFITATKVDKIERLEKKEEERREEDKKEEEKKEEEAIEGLASLFG
ncbi:MAG: 50S ribosomal protein L10 [Archaeoglobaceae archaeon]|nr:50S ribosomal protein L10 [Archaeoglobaceae archaeon]MDW7989644.1 50S ribosomal protein L10 [Archaeoglobaceae archaeon]